MRLFIAVNFDQETKDNLLSIQKKLRASAKSGNFSRPENLHLTLLFLGEVENPAVFRNLIDRCFTKTFDLQFSRTGNFNGDLYWVGVKSSPVMSKLYEELCEGAIRGGLLLKEHGHFSPHITLARQIELTSAPNLSFTPFSMHVSRVSLMKSERLNGKLTYTEIYGKSIRDN